MNEEMYTKVQPLTSGWTLLPEGGDWDSNRSESQRLLREALMSPVAVDAIEDVSDPQGLLRRLVAGVGTLRARAPHNIRVEYSVVEAKRLDHGVRAIKFAITLATRGGGWAGRHAVLHGCPILHLTGGGAPIWGDTEGFGAFEEGSEHPDRTWSVVVSSASHVSLRPHEVTAYAVTEESHFTLKWDTEKTLGAFLHQVSGEVISREMFLDHVYDLS